MSTSADTIVSCTEQSDASAMFTVVGTDTYLGAHMEKHLRSKFQLVYGYSQNEEIAVDIREIPGAFFYFLEKFSPPQTGEFFESQKEEQIQLLEKFSGRNWNFILTQKRV